MDAIELKQTFKHEGLTYLVMISSSGGFGFELVGGNTPKGSAYDRKRANDLWYHDTPNYEDVDLLSNALPVYRKAAEILVEWFYTKRPWRVHFSASTERKVKIYRWFAARLAKRLGDYSLVEYPTGVFNFYRVETNAEEL